jgi:hypothetical protein
MQAASGRAARTRRDLTNDRQKKLIKPRSYPARLAGNPCSCSIALLYQSVARPDENAWMAE